MDVTVRELQPGEWDKLPREDGEYLPDPDHSVAIVALDEDGDGIGRVFLVQPVHLEGIFIEHKWRSGLVMSRLVREAEKKAKESGLKKLLAFAVSEEMEGYIKRLGYEKQPWCVYAKELTCQ